VSLAKKESYPSGALVGWWGSREAVFDMNGGNGTIGRCDPE